MTDIEGFLTIYGHSDNLLNNNVLYTVLSLFNLSRMVLKLVSVFVVNKLNAQ